MGWRSPGGQITAYHYVFRTGRVVAKVFDRTIGALIEVRNSLSAHSVAKAIELLSHASRIEFYGAGGSGIAAQDGGIVGPGQNLSVIMQQCPRDGLPWSAGCRDEPPRGW